MNIWDRALASGNPNITGNGVPVCDHAAPPVGFHYEQKPGTTGSCNLVLKANAATGSGGSTGSGSGSSGSGSSGSGSGGGSTNGSLGANGGTSGGVTTAGGGNTTTPATTSAVTDQIKAGIIVAVILWAVKHFLGTGKS